MNNLIRLSLYAFLGVACFVAPAAEARERHLTGTVTNGAGQSRNFDRNVTAGGGNRTATTTVANPETGKSVNKTVNRSWDPQAGTGNRTVTRTGPNGETGSRSTNWVRNPDGTYSYDGTATKPDGTTRTYEGTLTRP